VSRKGHGKPRMAMKGNNPRCTIFCEPIQENIPITNKREAQVKSFKNSNVLHVEEKALAE
jgi:hypothetical protein